MPHWSPTCLIGDRYALSEIMSDWIPTCPLEIYTSPHIQNWCILNLRQNLLYFTPPPQLLYFTPPPKLLYFTPPPKLLYFTAPQKLLYVTSPQKHVVIPR